MTTRGMPARQGSGPSGTRHAARANAPTQALLPAKRVIALRSRPVAGGWPL
jgi:hypothetical protein